METLKVGRDKVETPVTEVSEKDLKWYATECRSAPLKRIAQRELARRAGGARPQAAAQPAQGAGRAQSSTSLTIEGQFSEPRRATQALKDAAEACHLISPATMVGSLPEGCSVALALVRISPNDSHLYKVGDKLALDRTHLASIANAVGACVVHSRRTDDGSDPHYCAWNSRVRYRQFDGTWLEREGSVEIDLRAPDGAEYVDAVRKAEKAGRDPSNQLGELRRFITRHAESKALNRAYAALGIRRSYTRDELEKPFCVARVVFTGQSDDPEARRQFRQGIMQSFLGASSDAYGPESGAPALHPPPPTHGERTIYDTEGEEYPPEEWATAPEPVAQQSAPAPAPAPTEQGSEDRGTDPENY